MLLRRLRARLRLNKRAPDRRNQRGVALVMAISCLALLTYFAMEIMYDAGVEYTVNAQALNRLKAYYAAKSGLELSLLRIKIYQQVKNQVGKDAGPYGQYIDEIWKFPLSWPIQLPPEMSGVDKDAAAEITKESAMDASFTTDIQDEGSKIDLGDLISTSKTLREMTHKRLVEILTRQVETNDDWRNKYGSYRWEELINNIADWMSDKSSSLNGGDKKSGYSDLNTDRDYFPPSRGFRTVQEMRLVKDMNDDFFDLLAPQVTIYGMRGVNPNVASKDVLKSLDPGITDEVADQIELRRSDPAQQPFQSADEFWTWVTGPPAAARLENQNHKDIPLYFDSLISFRVRTTGEFGGARREIMAIVTDLDRTAARIKEFIDKDKKDQQGTPPPGTPPPTQTGQTPKNNPLPKGPPRIVYWSER